MISPDDLYLMAERDKLDLLRRVSEAEEWQDCFEPLYLRLVEDDSPRVREEAVAALWSLADPRHIDLLMHKAEADPDEHVRGRAASVLGVFLSEEALEGGVTESDYLAVRKFLLDLARNDAEDLFVRRMAVEALGFASDEEVHEVIEWAYRHVSREMKLSALFAMGRSRSPRWYGHILSELDSRDKPLRLEAIQAAAAAELSAATPKLRNLARGRDKETCLAALWALAHTGGPGALETLEMSAQSEDPEIRDAAAEAIEEYERLRRERDELAEFEED